MPVPCPFDIASVTPQIQGCPPDNSYLMFIGGSLPDGIGFKRWGDIKDCLTTQLLGGRIVTFNGGQLQVGNAYPNTDWNGLNLLVFYNGLNKFLSYNPSAPSYPTSEYQPISGGGVQILIPGTYTTADIFVVFPNGS
jgi:hypothetical protein